MQALTRTKALSTDRLVEGSEIDTASALKKYDIPPSTYYRWKRKMKSMGINGLEDNKPYRAKTWNQLLPDEIDKILEYATFNPELSSREISCKITDLEHFSVSEASVYRVLKRNGMILNRR